MPTKEELENDLRQAMRQGDDLHKRTLRMALAAIKLAEVERREALGEGEILRVLQKEAKSRQETIEDAKRAGRDDLIESARAEIAVLEAYLPQAMTAAEIEKLARTIIGETGASGLADMGKVMGTLMARTAGRADGQQVNAVVRRLLESGPE